MRQQSVPTGYVDGGTGTMVQAQGVGNPINSFYVYQQVYDEAGKPIEGLYVDRNGDGQVNESDNVFLQKTGSRCNHGLHL